MITYYCKINSLEVFNKGILIFRAWKVEDNKYCLEHSNINEKLCDLSLEELLENLKKLNISQEYIYFSFCNTIYIPDIK